MKLQVTIPADLIEWMDLQVKKRLFFHRSHMVEVALLDLKNSVEAGGHPA